MSDYSNKLLAISAKKQKLIEEEARLIEKRKEEISILAERYGLLMVADDVVIGIFLEASTFIKDNHEKVKEWKEMGARFLNTKKSSTSTSANSSSTTKAESEDDHSIEDH